MRRVTVRMLEMKKSLKVRSYKLPDRLLRTMRSFGQRHGLTDSEVLRQAVANYVGDPSLAGDIHRGRPRT